MAKIIEKTKEILKTYKIFVIIIAVIVVAALIFLGVVKYQAVTQKNAELEKINSTILTLDDVMGTNLPSAPDKELNDSTIEGIDANNNNIRDDVELAIFNKYPDEARMRAAMLQYAQSMQLEMTVVNSEESMREYLGKKESVAYTCLLDAVKNYNDGENWNFLSKIRDNAEEEIMLLVLNNEGRAAKFKDILEEYMTSYTLSKASCDVDLSTLAN